MFNYVWLYYKILGEDTYEHLAFVGRSCLHVCLTLRLFFQRVLLHCRASFKDLCKKLSNLLSGGDNLFKCCFIIDSFLKCKTSNMAYMSGDNATTWELFPYTFQPLSHYGVASYHSHTPPPPPQPGHKTINETPCPAMNAKCRVMCLTSLSWTTFHLDGGLAFFAKTFPTP